MKIKFYKPKNVNWRDELIAPITARISGVLHRFNNQITRVEVHLSDDSGKIAGVNDKRCMILVEVQGLQPISITGHAGSYENAVNDAILKLKMSLYATYGRLRVF
ncbi:MAG: HPF/RaiA family ribosome-associated protein [Bacteroidales bacterium]|nr:HPF/RaiA family ribosome-associated protein [Bacteroidales bacterium]